MWGTEKLDVEADADENAHDDVEFPSTLIDVEHEPAPSDTDVGTLG